MVAEAPVDRFTPPKACVSTRYDGRPVYGLPEKPIRRPLMNDYENEMADRNALKESQYTAPPSGRRFAAGQDYLTRLGEAKQSYDDWRMPNKATSKETLTSLDNPLRTQANDPSDRPYYKAKGIAVVQVEETQAPCGKRCFQRNYNYGMTEQLAAGSLLPLTGEEIRRGRRDARLAVSSRPCTPGGVGSDTAAQCMSDGSPSVYECGEQADPSAFPCIDEAEKERLRQAFLNPSFQELDAKRALEQRIAREWPHGAPRHVLIKLAAEYGVSSALEVPSVGFGCPSSTNSRLAAAMLRG